jgi:hypothetical protein
VYVRVAGLTIQLTWSDTGLQGLRIAPGPAYARFLVPAAPADVHLTIVADRMGDDGARECLFDSGGPWRLHRHDDGLLFRFFSATLESAPYKTAQFSPDFSRGRIALNLPFFAGGAAVDPLEYPLDELLIISLLGQRRGIEIHGCAVAEGAMGYLFVGQSGAGKSTMARLWLAEAKASVLSDDRVVLRHEADGLWAYGTPWHGEAPLASPGRVRLAGIFFLRHDASNAVTPIPRAAAIARLFAASFPPFHDPAAVAFSLELLEAVLDRTPAFELGFAPNPAVLAFLRQALLSHRA